MTQDVFTALADPTRRALLGELSAGERAVGELVAAVDASQPTVSKHLRVLRESGLVHQRAVGQKRFYSIEAPVLLTTADTLRDLACASTPAPASAQEEAPAPEPQQDDVPAPAPEAQPAVVPEAGPAAEFAEAAQPETQPAPEMSPAEEGSQQGRRGAPAHRAETAEQAQVPRRLDPLSAPQEEPPARTRGVGGLVSTVLRRRRR